MPVHLCRVQIMSLMLIMYFWHSLLHGLFGVLEFGVACVALVMMADRVILLMMCGCGVGQLKLIKRFLTLTKFILIKLIVSNF